VVSQIAGPKPFSSAHESIDHAACPRVARSTPQPHAHQGAQRRSSSYLTLGGCGFPLEPWEWTTLAWILALFAPLVGLALPADELAWRS
jgi:hypothetical protein